MASADDPISHLYNTSFNLHRLTQLNLTGAITAPATLKFHSTRLTNVLRGDVLRGVRITDTLAEDSATKTGSIQRATLSSSSVQTSESTLTYVAILFKYTNITYSAFLVQSPSRSNKNGILTPDASVSSGRRSSTRRSSARVEQSNHYPLLLTRLPVWLQSRFFEYLAENFDCHVSSLRLPYNFITRALESHLEYYVPTNDPLTTNKPTKSLQIWLEPPTIPAKDDSRADKPIKLQTLKSILMTFATDDITGIMYKGQQIKLAQEKQQVEGEGLIDDRGPFEMALTLYAYHHLGIYVEKMRIQKVACGDFVLGLQNDNAGKCKLFPPVDGDGDVEMRDNDENGRMEGMDKQWNGLLNSLVDAAY